MQTKSRRDIKTVRETDRLSENKRDTQAKRQTDSYVDGLPERLTVRQSDRLTDRGSTAMACNLSLRKN